MTLAAAGLFASNFLVGFAGFAVIGSLMVGIATPRLAAVRSVREQLTTTRSVIGTGLFVIGIWMLLTFKIESGVGFVVLSILFVAVCTALLRFTREDPARDET